MRGASTTTVVLALGSFLFAPTAIAKDKVLKAPEVVEEQADDLTRLNVKGDPAAVGFLSKAFETEKDVKYGLLVALHGHGGDAKTMTFRDLGSKRKCFVLAVQGHTASGPGFAWDEKDCEYVAGLTLWVTEHYPVDRAAVLLLGHSAGGTMTLATYKLAPKLFTGLATSASPGLPESAHNDVRTVVFLGDQDPNFSGAGGVRNNFASKKRTAPGSFRIVKGLGHEFPDHFYVSQALDWLLDAKARGGEASLPKEPPVAADRPFAHILLRHAGSKGADDRARGRSAAQAQGELKAVKKLVEKSGANFFWEAAVLSHDDRTAASGGLIDEEGLAAFAPALRDAAAALDPGKLTDPIESPEGSHLILRVAKPGVAR